MSMRETFLPIASLPGPEDEVDGHVNMNVNDETYLATSSDHYHHNTLRALSILFREQLFITYRCEISTHRTLAHE